eukprot:CAMPEP_0185315698 /NCGR_PEP_ID=MMETSP1363-20130426/42141_1 /TAXON_ID=38817 /ORGANISM="Gephyrocapsa oceanica, Strain RCC1303" /LENGTH=66 /DNA_ID=CAMNT_0027913817 /DNA_START=182 /DNA_END=382 /DNA_ORIENTATION=-
MSSRPSPVAEAKMVALLGDHATSLTGSALGWKVKSAAAFSASHSLIVQSAEQERKAPARKGDQRTR